nr:MAG TPA: hypothetical protein [Caudoviricetes sp.]
MRRIFSTFKKVSSFLKSSPGRRRSLRRRPFRLGPIAIQD